VSGLRVAVCVKHVPVLAALRLDPETRRLRREGVPGEPSAFDVRAVVAAVALRGAHGGEVVVVTVGPPVARETLVACLALGADRAVHVSDPALAGSDTLATARALAAALRREAPDLVLLGRASTDAETGQVGPEVAELLGLPQATCVRALALDPAARTFTAERETDEGFERVTGPLPAVITVAEDVAAERFPSRAEREAAKTKPVAAADLAALGVPAEDVGVAGSPTWVAGLEPVALTRRGEIVGGETPAAQVAALAARLRELGATGPQPDVRPALPAVGPRRGAPVWVVVEPGPAGHRPVTAELLGRAAALGALLDAPVEAVVLGSGVDAAALAASGADRVLVAEDAALVPYTTDAHAGALAAAIRARRPRLVLLASTVRGRDLAPRVAARLGLGLTGDAIDLVVDADGNVRQMKPAFGGTVVAPIVSRTRPEMATVRPGVLVAARPDPARPVVVERLAVVLDPPRVRVLDVRPVDDRHGAALDAADVVLGVGRGIGGPAALPGILDAAARLGAAVAATREVTDAGWLPKQCQVGLTGRAIAPRLYVALGIAGAPEHVTGLRRAGTVVAVNRNAKAPIFRHADLGVVADWAAVLPLLVDALVRP
jgi:electron transfer flavoprotein alpha subunit